MGQDGIIPKSFKALESGIFDEIFARFSKPWKYLSPEV
jgi:hypothetical protein